MRAETVFRNLILAFALCLGPQCSGQDQRDSGDANSLLSRIRTLSAAGQWEEIIRLAPATPEAPADFDYYRGIALARLEHWQEAEAAFESGRTKAPRDIRFPLELAGVMFKAGKRGEARSFLKQALQLDPADAYGNDFLASLYFLNGNLEAALKFWNRVDKPQVREVNIEPSLRVDPVLLDRSFAFSPGAPLTLKEYYASRTSIDSLGIYSSPRFELLPRDDGSFDLGFRALERNGGGDSWLDGLVSLLRGAPYRTVHPEFFNIRGAAWNLISLGRWDAQKRRLFTEVSGPVGGSPGLRFQARLDARRENWDVAASLRNPAFAESSFTMSTLETGAAVQTFLGSRTSMRNGVIVSDRRFNTTPPGSAAWQALFRKGITLEYEIGLRQSRSAPEHRFELSWSTESRIGKILSASDGAFLRITGTLEWHLLPQASGKDYQLSGRLGAGTTAGHAPFEEMFSLGMERDNDLYLRGHSGTRDGRKGAGPLGRRYLLMNWQLDKLIHQPGFWELSLGPFLDTGKMYDSTTFFGSPGFGTRAWSRS